MLLRALILLATLVAVNQQTGTVEVTFRVTVPADTPAEASIHIAGDFQGWNPGSPSHRLAKVGEHVYEIVLTFDVGSSIEYKFTRGDWERVEKGPRGEEISNRRLSITASAVTEHTVANWRDMSSEPPRKSTITGNVSLISVPGFLDGRRVWVYLPPGYDDSDERYPVLYMLDGQNVFDAATSFAGEWEVDDSCERLIAAGEMRPIIVVAVANGETKRGYEYTPWYDTNRGGGGGEAQVREFIDVLVPFVSANYRTLTGPANTGFSGSSLGGLMAMYVAYEHAETFGLVAALSPSLQWNNNEMIRIAATSRKPDVRVYMDMGTLEWGPRGDRNRDGVDDAVDLLREMREAMLEKGFVLDDDLLVVEDEGAKHHETHWASRFPVALKFLFPAR